MIGNIVCYWEGAREDAWFTHPLHKHPSFLGQSAYVSGHLSIDSLGLFDICLISLEIIFFSWNGACGGVYTSESLFTVSYIYRNFPIPSIWCSMPLFSDFPIEFIYCLIFKDIQNGPKPNLWDDCHLKEGIVRRKGCAGRGKPATVVGDLELFYSEPTDQISTDTTKKTKDRHWSSEASHMSFWSAMSKSILSWSKAIFTELPAIPWSIFYTWVITRRSIRPQIRPSSYTWASMSGSFNEVFMSTWQQETATSPAS